MDIHIFWEGPFSIEEIRKRNNGDSDYGVYQVYGNHPLYGNSVLLYIGQANLQVFSTRLNQENWLYENDPHNTEFYVGRLAGHKSVSAEEWGTKIDQAEKLLIFAHQPCHNTSNTKSIPKDYVLNNHIYNWGCYRNLFPEVSGKRFTSKFNHILEDNIYSYKNIQS